MILYSISDDEGYITNLIECGVMMTSIARDLNRDVFDNAARYTDS